MPRAPLPTVLAIVTVLALSCTGGAPADPDGATERHLDDGGSAAAPTEAERTEAPDPPMENLLTADQAAGRGGWFGLGNAVLSEGEDALVVTFDRDGAFSDDTSSVRVGTATTAREGVPAVAGEGFHGRVAVRGPAGARARAELRWHDDEGIIDTSLGDLAELTDGWTELSHTSDAPDGVTSVSLRVYVEAIEEGDRFSVQEASLARRGPLEAASEPERDPDLDGAALDPSPMDVPDTDVPDILLDPERFGFPGPTTTGVRDPDALEVVEGRITLDQDGQVLEDTLVRGRVYVIAADTVIRNVRIETSAEWGVHVDAGRGGRDLVIEDSEIIGQGETCLGGVAHSSYTARRVEVTNCDDGFRFGSDTTIEDSFVHGLRKSIGDEHNDAMQTTGGSNVVIRNNTMISVWQRQTSAILLQAILSPIDDVIVEGNLMSGGTFTIYVEGVEGQPGPTNVTIRDNVLVGDSWRYGHYTTTGGPDVRWEGNRTHDDQVLDPS